MQGIRRGFYVVVLLSVAGCGPDASTAQEPLSIEDGSAAVTPSFDLDTLTTRLRQSYRERDGALVAARPTYGVRSRDGVVEITPRHHVTTDAESGEPARTIEGPAVRLETVAISRDVSFDLGAPRTSAIEGTIQIERSVAQEQFINREAGVEQLWLFDAAPAGQGNLEIRVHLDGLAYVGQSEEGHHFADETTRMGIRYGLATWIDGAAQETEVPVEFEDGDLVLTVPRKTVDESVYPAILDPTIFAEFGLTLAGVGPSVTDEETPAVAFDGTNWLVVWSDLRTLISKDIYGTRVDANGNPIETVSIPICTANYDQVAPAVAFNGSRYLVVWADSRTGSGAGNYDIRGALVDTAGVVSPDFVISNAADNQVEPDVAWAGAGDTFVVTWQDRRSGIDAVYAGRIDGGGNRLDGNGFSIDDGLTAERFPAVACNGTNCLFCWQDGNPPNEDPVARRFDPFAGTIDISNIALKTNRQGRDSRCDVAYDGTANYVAVWQDSRAGNFDIYAGRVAAADGTSLDVMTNGILVTGAIRNQTIPSITFDSVNNQFLVAWQDLRGGDGTTSDVYGARLSTAGVVLDATGRLYSGGVNDQLAPAIAFGASRSLVTWQDNRREVDGRFDIQATQVNANGGVTNSTGTVLALAQGRQTSAAIAHDGTRYFVVYSDSQLNGAGNLNIRAVRVNNDGTVLDPNGGRTICNAVGNQSAPDIAWNGTQFLVVWADRRNGNWDIFGTRVDSNYQVLDGSGFPIATGAEDQNFPKVAYNAHAAAQAFLVAWQDRRSGTNWDIYAGRVRNNGTLMDGNGVVIANAANDQRRPDVASDNVNWIVVWDDRRSGVAGGEDIYSRRFIRNGTLSPEQLVTNAANAQTSPTVVFNGTTWFAAWTDTRSDPMNYDIYGTRIFTTGVTANPGSIAMVTGPLDSYNPALVAVGGAHFMVYRQEVALGSPDVDLYGGNFTQGGLPSGAAFIVSNDPGNEDEPAIGARNATDTLVAYQRFVAASSSVRVRARRVTVP